MFIFASSCTTLQHKKREKRLHLWKESEEVSLHEKIESHRKGKSVNAMFKLS